MTIPNTIKNDVIYKGGRNPFKVPIKAGESVPVGFVDWDVRASFTAEETDTTSLIPDIDTTSGRIVLEVDGDIVFDILPDETLLLVDSDDVVLSFVFIGIWRDDTNNEKPIALYKIPIKTIPIPP